MVERMGARDLRDPRRDRLTRRQPPLCLAPERLLLCAQLGCEGLDGLRTIEDNVFIGHNVTFINDRFPRATIADGTLQREAGWGCEPTVVQCGASIGSSAAL